MSDPRRIEITYNPTATGREFHAALGMDVRAIMGPIASGKSSVCCWDVVNLCSMIPPDNDGVRKMHTAFIRNTLPQLLETTKETWKNWFGPQYYGEWYGERLSAPYKIWLRIPPGRNPFMKDGTGMELEISLMAMDSPDAARNLLSLDLTNAWINEAREINWEIVQAALGRTGRYPNHANFSELPPAVAGVVMDTNPPDTDSWWYKKLEEARPNGWHIFRQPPAMINLGTPKAPRWVRNDGKVAGFKPAENVENIPARWGYYEKLVAANDVQWLDVMVAGNYGSVSEGSPVFTEYQDPIHWAGEDLPLLRNVPLCLAWDFGRTPCCILMQMSRSGQVRIIREIIGTNIDVYSFATQVVNPLLVAEYDFHRLNWFGVGDPAGAQRGQERDDTNFAILREVGLPASPCPTNLFPPRRLAVAHFLRTLSSDGSAGLIVGNGAPFVRKAFARDYKYRTFSPGQSETTKFEPIKNEASHPMDAIQYGCYAFKHGLYTSDGQDAAWGSRTSERSVDEVPIDMSGFM